LGLLGKINILPVYKNPFLRIKSSTLTKKCPRKAVAHWVEVRGEELAGAGRAVRLLLLSHVSHATLNAEVSISESLASSQQHPCKYRC